LFRIEKFEVKRFGFEGRPTCFSPTSMCKGSFPWSGRNASAPTLPIGLVDAERSAG
jgi:hypothetical protein